MSRKGFTPRPRETRPCGHVPGQTEGKARHSADVVKQDLGTFILSGLTAIPDTSSDLDISALSYSRGAVRPEPPKIS
jgi:hypothetical protein